MRCFLALPVPEPLIPPLLEVQEAVPVGRAVPEENLHVTLAFLDDLSDPEIDALYESLSAQMLPGCWLGVTGLMSLGSKAPRLLAAEIEREPGLVALHEAVAGRIRAAGIARPRERFRPHVTLVRFPGTGLRGDGLARLDRAMAGIAGLTLPPRPGDCVQLMASTLTPQGSIYETLAAWPLPQIRG